MRGHSNVQGQRTVGITEKPELVPLDKLKELYGFEPPREKGLQHRRGLRGHPRRQRPRPSSASAATSSAPSPIPGRMEAAWRRQRLTVQISTKLNRTHLVHGDVAYILPCLGRIEIDRQASGPQAVSMEDSTARFHGSRGVSDPVGPHVRSEPWIVAEIAKATLPPNPRIDWDAWVADYGRVRDAIEATYPTVFHDFNGRMFQPGGITKPLGARDRKWETRDRQGQFRGRREGSRPIRTCRRTGPTCST